MREREIEREAKIEREREKERGYTQGENEWERGNI